MILFTPRNSFLAVLALSVTLPLFAQESGWVVLPVGEYATLKARANPPQPDPAKPPAEAVVTRIDYDLRIQNQSAAGRAVLTIDVFKTGWVKVRSRAHV